MIEWTPLQLCRSCDLYRCKMQHCPPVMILEVYTRKIGSVYHTLSCWQVPFIPSKVHHRRERCLVGHLFSIFGILDLLLATEKIWTVEAFWFEKNGSLVFSYKYSTTISTLGIQTNSILSSFLNSANKIKSSKFQYRFIWVARFVKKATDPFLPFVTAWPSTTPMQTRNLCRAQTQGMKHPNVAK